MQFAKTKREATVAALAARLYQVHGRPDLARQAEAALLKANPSLANLGKAPLPAGTLILVPPVAGLRINAESPPVADGIQDALDAITALLIGAKASLQASDAGALADLRQLLEDLKSNEVIELANRIPQVKQLCETIAAEAKRRQSEVQAAANQNERALEALQRSLAAMKQRAAL